MPTNGTKQTGKVKRPNLAEQNAKLKEEIEALKAENKKVLNAFVVVKDQRDRARQALADAEVQQKLVEIERSDK